MFNLLLPQSWAAGEDTQRKDFQSYIKKNDSLSKTVIIIVQHRYIIVQMDKAVSLNKCVIVYF